MRFGFDDDQLAFRDAVRDLLDKECPPEPSVRAAWDAPAPGAARPRACGTALAEMGVLGIAVPEADGGLGLDERSLVLVLEEAGRAALPHPLVETAAVAAPLVAGGGEVRPAGVPDAGLGMVASDLGGPHVACAADADWLLLRDPDGGRAAPRRRRPPSRSRRSTPSTRARRAATRRLAADARARVRDRRSRPPSPLAFDRGALGTAAQLVGLGQRMLDLTVAYVDRAPAVRRADRVVPGGQAPPGRRPQGARLRPPRRPPGRPLAGHRTPTPARRDVSMAKAMASDAAWFVGPRRPSSATAPSATRSSTTCTCT